MIKLALPTVRPLVALVLASTIDERAKRNKDACNLQSIILTPLLSEMVTLFNRAEITRSWLPFPFLA